MTAPLRLPPIAPPPLPSFVRARPGTLPSAGAHSGASSAVGSRSRSGAARESPGFSLDLAHATPGRSSEHTKSPLVERLTDALTHHLEDVDAMQTRDHAMTQVQRANTSETEVLTAAQKADLAFQLLMEIRNKLMDAYREVQQIQI